MKCTFASLAHAFTKYVFPVPGAPYIKVPPCNLLAPSNNCGYNVGKIINSFR